MFNLLFVIIYISFVSLGLPDALLGSAWPVMHEELSANISWAGIISMIISLGTIVSSLMSDRMTRWLGTGKLTAISVAVTAIALFAFSLSGSFWLLCLWAVPYGLGAGSVDASLNNYVALHYESRHMSWLHCAWGIGASLGPYIMGLALTGGLSWQSGYRVIGIFQLVLTAVLFFSLPMWKSASAKTEGENEKPRAMGIKEQLCLPGVIEVMFCFFCYCAIEQTAGLWASTYLSLYKGVEAEISARFGAMFFIGIALGRALSGFLTRRFKDDEMIVLGEALILLGIIAMLLPLGKSMSLAGLILIGLGCAPIYPCTIHATPERFGAANSQAIIGLQMASAYTGVLVMPAIFGLIAEHISASLMPVYMLLILSLSALMHRRLIRKTA